MNILVALNSNYIGPLGVMLHSMSLSNPNERFDIYVAHSSLTADDFAIIDNSVDLSRFTIHPIHVPDELLRDAPILERTSKETYYRLLATDILPEEVDRILYIDPDIVVINPLDEFYNIDMGDNYLAAAEHVGPFLHWVSTKRLKMPIKTSQYINAGVLMMNLKAMRKTETADKIFDFIKTTPMKLYLADQDVINALYFDKTLYINTYLYNLDEKTYKRGKKEKGMNLEWVEKNSVIVHFNGKYKPWKPDYKGELEGFYFKYAEN